MLCQALNSWQLAMIVGYMNNESITQNKGLPFVSTLFHFYCPSQALKSGVFSVLTMHSLGPAGFKSILIRLLE